MRFIQIRSKLSRKMLIRVLSGIVLFLMVMIAIAYTAPSLINISDELPLRNQVVAAPPESASESIAEPVNCQVAGLAISPIRVNPGEEATIAAYVVNSGDKEVNYVAKLEINKIVVQAVEVTIPAGLTKSIIFPLSRDEPGTYDIGCGALTTQLVVINPVIPSKSNVSLFSSPYPSINSCCPLPDSSQGNTEAPVAPPET